ncbi:LuxR C-terminal-related transcriptional regulator [Marinactinospora rubrisoli]|uniref:LuxR C-terminal-related transcriptional regulator n=1 Tax=Marinactinospora rubrisoli TaxID=2715399 RepID=A0ABW2KHV8_9ACTN
MALHTAPARQNLPLEPNNFVGRERDLSDLLRLLQANRMVTLCGVGGIGKTRLALRVAAHASGVFADGVWLVELADARTRRGIVARTAAVLGVAEESDRELVDTLHDALRRRHLLLVLDNCEHVIDEVAALARTLVDRCPSVTLLLTSREPARIGGEVVWRVPPLAVPPPDEDDDPGGSEAVRLFVERAHAAVPHQRLSPDQLRTVAEICRRLDGIPLGIELAAARVRLLSLAQIADRLDDRFRLLTDGGRGAPARQRTLRAVIDWSHDLLCETERVLFRRLSVFTSWHLELAERVCADALLPEGEILDAIASLVDRSLVVVIGEYQGRVRYRLLDTIRQYAAERLAEAGERPVVEARLRDQMLALAEELAANAVRGHGIAWPDRFEVWYRVLAEYENVRVVLAQCAEQNDVESGLRLCVSMRPFWMASGYFSEGASWSDLFLSAECGGDALRGQAMVRRAELAWDQRDHRHAAEIGERGLRLCRAAGDTASVALALNILAMVDLRAGARERAATRLAEVLELTRAVGDPWNEGIARGTLGALAAQRGDLAAASAHYDAALVILRGIDHRWGVGRTLIGQGMVAETQGDLFGADRCYREALDIQRGIGATPELARCLAGVGRIAARQGATAQAYDYLSESLLLSHGTGQRLGVARGLSAIARIAAPEGVVEEACLLAGAAAAIRERAGAPGPALPWPEEDAPAGVDPETVSAWLADGRGLDLDAAVSLALRVTESRQRPRTRPAAGRPPGGARPVLTPREQEIALLIGERMSNRLIAERLFISPTTVARHIANIHTKLGFNSRTQIAAWVRDQKGGHGPNGRSSHPDPAVPS